MTRIEARQSELVSTDSHREDSDSSNFIACTFTIQSILYFTLIDIDSTHSYVSSMVSDKLRIEIKEIFSDVTIVSSLGQFVVVNKIYRRCPLEIQCEVFPVYLMELPFGDFDLILGMEWLVEHYVSLDCATKRVTLKKIDR